MGLEIEKVHILSRKAGTNQPDTVKVNPYVRLISEGEFPVSIQAGRFYTDGGDRIMVKDLKPWVKSTVRKMSLEALATVGLEEDWEGVEKPPESEVQILKTPTNPEVPDQRKTVVDVVYELDPLNDDHWTKEGKPDLQAVTYGMDGKYTTRADIEEATGGFRRPGSEVKENSDGDS